MVLSNYLINYKLGMSGSENEKLVQKMIESMPAVMLLNAGILAPFNEEMTFRKAFRNVFTNKWLFALSSGLIFGFLHVVESAQYLYILPYGHMSDHH